MAELTELVDAHATADVGRSFNTPDDGRLKNQQDVDVDAHKTRRLD